nr:cupin domain-containing protein [Burkholderiales bacterium]
MHYVLRATEMRPKPAYRGNSKSYGRVALVDDTVGSVHMGLGLCALRAGGEVDTHLHSLEESFYVLEGDPVLVIDGHGVRLMPGACGLVPLGVPHA